MFTTNGESRRGIKTYPIRTNEEYGIIAGLWNERQVLIDFQHDGSLILMFTPEGELEATQFVPCCSSTTRDADQTELRQQVQHDAPIRIKRFFLESQGLGIQDYPSILQDVFETLFELGEDDLEYWRGELSLWERTGQFVLHWHGEYYLNQEGRVVSS